MPNLDDVLNDHAGRVKSVGQTPKKIIRSGARRPWQEELDPKNDIEPKIETSGAAVSALNSIEDRQFEVTHAPMHNPHIPPSGLEVSRHQVKSATPPKVRAVKLGLKVEKDSALGDVSLGQERLSRDLSSHALFLIGLCQNLGFELAMKAVVLRELSTVDGIVQCSQIGLAALLKISEQTSRRVFLELETKGFLILKQDYDPKSRSPKMYQISASYLNSDLSPSSAD